MRKNRRRYDHQTLYEERQYGLYWYDWLWSLARPGAGRLFAPGSFLYWRDFAEIAPVKFRRNPCR